MFVSSALSSQVENSSAGRPVIQSSTAEDLLFFFDEEELIIATRNTVPVKKAPAIATVVTEKEIRNMGALNLMDVLKTVPGIGVSITEYGDTMFEVRGIRTQMSEKILLMIDGHPMNGNFSGSALRHLFNDLTVENIKRVEIVRGPGSALYGANAFVAVINVVMKEAADTNGLQLKGGYGSSDTRHLSATGGKVFGDDVRISGSIDYFRSDGAKIRIEEDILSGTPFSTAPGNAFIGVEKTDLFLRTSLGDLTFRGHYLKKDLKND
ncbi:MAG: TonB-dependent receptor plug domain-containing protein, partial [Nitrospirota bacterium]